MEFKGTKGEWEVNGEPFFNDGEHHGCFKIESGDTTACQVFAYSFYNLTIKEARANALLISKAPEMLEMLESIVSDFEGDYVLNGEVVDKPYPWLIDRYKEAKQLIKQATEL